MKILIINGPNLNLLGKREPLIYGNVSFDNYFEVLKNQYHSIEFAYFQSNIEGELINILQESTEMYDAVIINPGGYSHTSVAIADAIAYLNIPVIEVHISNVFSREDYRKTLITASKCAGCISGFGLDSYRLAVEATIKQIKEKNI